MRGLFPFILLTLRLNARSKQALIYGYLVPIFFLFAFGSVFRGGVPPLLGQMGQLLTISTLGGCCFGLPTAIVADRERGLWRRFKLLPVRLGVLLAGTLVARLVLVASAAVMQVLLARACYGTPWPKHPLDLLIAFCFVAFALLGLGLVIAALADNVPAVQALGQAVFLPMIMIGGVGVPLAVLPVWAQRVAGFLPGRYAVDALQRCYAGAGLSHTGFDLLAMVVIAAAALLAGTKLFRWDAGQKSGGHAAPWVFVALLAWVAVGVAADSTGRLSRVDPIATPHVAEPWRKITHAQSDSLTYNDLPDDGGTISPIAATTGDLAGPDRTRFDSIAAKLDAWPLAHEGSDENRVRALLSAAALADVTEDPLEAPIGRLVFTRLQADFDHDDLIQLLTWIVLHPAGGRVVTTAPELDLAGPVDDGVIRDRCVIYGKKFLGRLLGKIPDQGT